MALPVGTKAPDFALSTKRGDKIELVKLSDLYPGKNVLLLFFPMAFTSVCTSELCDASAGIAEYEKIGAAVYGISGDSPFSLSAWAEQESIRIPLLSDYNHRVAEAYGIAYPIFNAERNLPMSGVAQRSAFIVDRSGTIQYSETSADPRQLPSFAAIAARLKELA